ncbi:uncharacterized protein J8A68_001905 [[Candida] subhashii]|uniref:DNL-type domain-containing protein n=1 Tax=[Candida] subhashii TaxID=561895 RepID=A0A8J5UQ74_9ASCO|nr:uncharacterized protein J8A68_001905 [[Candida] subhashii]KAG7664561.1 hypothetical protein J8A68_001905 [[Candida] subhashii]
MLTRVSRSSLLLKRLPTIIPKASSTRIPHSLFTDHPNHHPSFYFIPVRSLTTTPTNLPQTTTQITSNDPNEPQVSGEYMIQFTCKPCNTRSTHAFSKQAYQYGTVLIQCPNCKSRHLIADNLGFIKDEVFNLEEVLASKGESVKSKRSDLEEGDVPEGLKGKLENVVSGFRIQNGDEVFEIPADVKKDKK